MNKNNIQPDISDDELRRMLQEKAIEPDDNPWFTPRVINRLPAHRPMLWLGIAMHVLAVLILVGCWVWLVNDVSSTHAYTVGDILTYAAIISVTGFTLKAINPRFSLDL